MNATRPHVLRTPATLPRLARKPAPGMLSRTAASGIDRWCLAGLIRMLRGVPVRCELWDGTGLTAVAPPVARVRIADRRTLLQLLRNPDLGFGEGYTDGRLEVDGDLVGLLTAVARRAAETADWRPWLLRRGGAGIPRATRNARYHYDLGNDFYRLWLDEQLVYTCAYFASPDASLEEAQRAKLELVARKLALSPGDMVYEAGCGWGALALHLVARHGVRVRAWNVSKEQIGWARRRASAEGLADRVEFIEGDYRTIDGTCDAFVSVGMLEHVGAACYADLGRVMDRCLHRPHGRGLLHFIGRNRPTPMSPWTSRYIFPGAYIPALREVVERVVEPHGFSVLDVENLRLHYALTLAHWLERFARAEGEVEARYGPAFVRMWRLYLAAAQAGFRGGGLQLFQVVFARGQNDAMPWTRDRLYRGAAGAA